MVERTEVALPGNPRLVTFSESGRLIGVGGYDGRALVIDAATGKTVCKHVVRARKNDLPILHHRFSDDDRYYGFSCASRVVVLDIEAGQLKKEIAISTAEAGTAVPFVFDRGASLIMADAGTIMRHALDAPEHEVLFKIEHGASSTALELDPTAQLIAYKCTAERWSAKALLFDLKQRALREIELPYEYVPGQQMSNAKLRFLESGTLAVLRKSHGLSHFDPQTLREISMLSWSDLGFRALFSFPESQLTRGGLLLVNAESSRVPDLAHWQVPIPEGLEWTLYDVAERRIILRVKNGARDLTVHPGTRRLARLCGRIEARKTDPRLRKIRASLVIEPWP